MAYKMGGDEVASATRARAAFSDRNVALNELRDAKLTEVQMRAQNIDAQTEAAQNAAANALERGDWGEHTQRQRQVAELAARRVQAENEYHHWQAQPAYPADPVADLIRAKASEPETVAWLQAHPSDAVALATGSDPSRVAKIQASHADAVAEGYTPGSAEYFRHVDNFLGAKAASRGSEGGNERRVRVVKGQASGENELTAGELRAANEDVLWGREGGAKCGEPIGVEEYLRRRNVMRKQAGWYDKLD